MNVMSSRLSTTMYWYTYYYDFVFFIIFLFRMVLNVIVCLNHTRDNYCYSQKTLINIWIHFQSNRFSYYLYIFLVKIILKELENCGNIFDMDVVHSTDLLSGSPIFLNMYTNVGSLLQTFLYFIDTNVVSDNLLVQYFVNTMSNCPNMLGWPNVGIIGLWCSG